MHIENEIVTVQVQDVNESEIPSIIQQQFQELNRLKHSVNTAIKKAEDAQNSANSSKCKSSGLFQKREAIEFLQSATVDLAKQETLNVVKQIKAQEDIMKKHVDLITRVRKHEEQLIIQSKKDIECEIYLETHGEKHKEHDKSIVAQEKRDEDQDKDILAQAKKGQNMIDCLLSKQIKIQNVRKHWNF